MRLTSIRSKMLTFAVIATLVPTVITTWVFYVQNRHALGDKIGEQLTTLSGEATRETDLWLKERLLDLKVFASSYEVTENVTRASTSRPALARATSYLNSVRERFQDYEELMVVAMDGHVVATSSGHPTTVELPADWQKEIRAGNPVLSDATWDPGRGKTVMLAAVPIHLATGQTLGALCARLNLASVDTILQRFQPGTAGRMYLATADGALVSSSARSNAALLRTKLAPGALRPLVARPGATVQFTDPENVTVAGVLAPVTQFHWVVLAEIPVAEAYRQVNRLRNVTLFVLGALLLGVGSIAYLLGLLIVRPLNRLSAGAAKVAAGDLSVDLPVMGGGEVTYLTEVFNDMVARLREGREKLERLSLTDGLTGLDNRRHLMQKLGTEIERARRHEHGFSVVMLDVDHFKDYNDTHGHLAGDDVLVRLGTLLRECTRDVDCSARFGGEEFVLVLPETSVERATDVAERVRARMAQEQFGNGRVTLSAGVAEFPAHGETPEAMLSAADAALYRAKNDGRDRVAHAAAAKGAPAPSPASRRK